MAGKIIIPVWHRRQMRTWQARLAHDPPIGQTGPPKYWSGRRVHQWLYGFDQALAVTGPVVVVEGVTSVWHLGAGAVAVFGRTVNRQQEEYLSQLALAHWRQTVHGETGTLRPIVIALDGDSEKGASSLPAAQQLAVNLAQQGLRAVVVKLPVGTQPDGLVLRGEFWPLVGAAMTSEGVVPAKYF